MAKSISSKFHPGKRERTLLNLSLNGFNNEDAFMGITLKVYLTLPMILLQKPSASSKAKDHSQALIRRMEWFKNGDYSRLLSECRNIQRQLRPKKSTAKEVYSEHVENIREVSHAREN